MLEFMVLSSGFFYKPFKTLSSLYENFRENLLKYGFGISILSNISLIIANLITGQAGFVKGAGFLISHIAFVLVISYFWLMIILALYTFFLGIYNQKIDVRELTGLYLAGDFPFFIAMPVALIFSVLPSQLGILFNIIMFVLFVLSIVLKIKAIIITSKVDTGKSIALFIMPYAFIVFLLSINMIYFILFIINILS
jgi:hypothetical protein